MGNVGSKGEDWPAVYLRDQTKLSIAALTVTNAKEKTLLTITPNSFPCTKVTAKRELGDNSLVEFVQDPEPPAQSSGILLKVTNEDEIYFNFTFNVRQRQDETVKTPVDTTITGLTFVFASNHKDVDNLVTREFHADPNLHKNASVHLVGDIATGGSPAVTFTWKWKWQAPAGAEEKNGGYRSTCSFVEYDQRAHRLTNLASFSIWVQNAPRYLLTPPSPANFGLAKQRISSYNASLAPRTQEDSENEGAASGSEAYEPAPVPPPAPIKVDVNCHRPADDNMGDDGPLFRATMKSLESRTATLRQKMKKVLKKAEQAKHAQGVSNDAVKEFIESLREAASSNASGIKPAMTHYFDSTAKEILRFEKQNEVSLQRLIIDPMNKLYNLDIKQAEAKKREFDEESRDYYSFVSKYLGMRTESSNQKKKTDSDEKYQKKRRNFEIKRFDYGSFMQDLHGGKKEQELLSHLTKYADAQAKSFLSASKKIQDNMPHLEALSYEVTEMDKEFQMQRTDREERRRGLEKSTMNYVEPDSLPPLLSPPPNSNQSYGLPSPSETNGGTLGRLDSTSTLRAVSSSNASFAPSNESQATLTTTNGTLSTSAPTTLSANTNLNVVSNKYKGIRDLEERSDASAFGDQTDRKKEGLLWALSRPGSHADPKGLNKQAWHKYWVVLAGGQLCEYSNWKEKLDLHNDPINLRMASARQARDSDRRFCFEVITPQYKRVYQGTSEEDMTAWITSINNAVKGTLEGGKSTAAFDSSKLDDDTPSKNISSVFRSRGSVHHPSSFNGPPPSSSNGSQLHRRITVGSSKPQSETRPMVERRSSNFGDDPEKLLQMVQNADPGNSFCADCYSQTKIEWVSINLGIFICIECSGIHRSLGTHISKVRSLTLDVTSFTSDLTDLLIKTGNTMSNKVWEAQLDLQQKPNYSSSREARLKFATAKYVERAYVQPLSSTLSAYATNLDVLIASVKENDIQQGIYALALKANPSHVDPATSTNVILTALVSADPVAPGAFVPPTPTGTTSPPNSPQSKKRSKDATTFPLAELLFQNGGVVDVESSVMPTLSASAKNYLNIKLVKALGSNTTSTLQGVSQSPQEKLEKEKRDREDRLRKRVSTSGRVTKAPPLDGGRGYNT